MARGGPRCTALRSVVAADICAALLAHADFTEANAEDHYWQTALHFATQRKSWIEQDPAPYTRRTPHAAQAAALAERLLARAAINVTDDRPLNEWQASSRKLREWAERVVQEACT